MLEDWRQILWSLKESNPSFTSFADFLWWFGELYLVCYFSYHPIPHSALLISPVFLFSSSPCSSSQLSPLSYSLFPPPTSLSFFSFLHSKLFLENVEIFHNCLKLPFYSMKIRLPFTALFRIRFRILIRIRIRIRIRNVYFGSRSGPDPAKSFASLRIRFRFRIRIRNTVPRPP